MLSSTFTFHEQFGGDPIHLEAAYDPNFDYISVREIAEDGKPLDEFVDYDPVHGGSDDEITALCDDMLKHLRKQFAYERWCANN